MPSEVACRRGLGLLHFASLSLLTRPWASPPWLPDLGEGPFPCDLKASVHSHRLSFCLSTVTICPSEVCISIQNLFPMTP